MGAEQADIETEQTETVGSGVEVESAEGMEGVTTEQNGEQADALQATQVDVDMPPTQVDEHANS
jgi:hypothetical protein